MTPTVIAKNLRPDAQLVGEIVQQILGNRLINAQAEAGIAQQTKLQGKAQLVPRATFGERFLKIIRGQSVVLDQVCFIDRYQEELIPLFLGK